MTQLQIIRHDDILLKDVMRIIAIKTPSWNYPIESQLGWMVKNLSPDDLHAIIIKDGEDVAYMDLVNVSATIDGVNESMLGIGCVCTKIHGAGDGQELMKQIAEYLNSNKKKGILFCRQKLIRFYQKYGWDLIPNEKTTTIHPEDDVYTMTFNCGNVETLIYNDKDF